MHRKLAAALLSIAAAAAPAAQADPVADFYRGRNINWILSTAVSGSDPAAQRLT